MNLHKSTLEQCLYRLDHDEMILSKGNYVLSAIDWLIRLKGNELLQHPAARYSTPKTYGVVAINGNGEADKDIFHFKGLWK